MGEITARRTGSDTRAIGEELEAVIARNVDHEAFGFARQIESAAKMIHPVILPGGVRHGDPPGVPGPGGKCGLRKEQEGKERFSHCV